jgi:endonuclease/exonuclease/phosphatase (EEP) superfamily protein YafD
MLGATRSWRVALVALLAVLLHLAWLVPPALERVRHSAPASGPGVTVRVLSLNIEFGQADLDTVLDVIERHRVDVVALQELTPVFAASFAHRAGEALPFSDVHAAFGPGGSGIWSRSTPRGCWTACTPRPRSGCWRRAPSRPG